jgi:uncharacterized membrane protein
MGGGAPIVAPFRNQMNASNRAAAVARSAPSVIPPPFYDVTSRPSGGIQRYRSSGDLPGGLTAEQWARLTPAQQQTLLTRERDADTRAANAAARGVTQASATAERALEEQRIREVAQGFAALASTVQGTFRTQQEQETERLRIAAAQATAHDAQQQETERARIAAAAGLSVNSASTAATTSSQASTVPTWVYWAGGAALLAGGYYVVKNSSRRRR